MHAREADGQDPAVEETSQLAPDKARKHGARGLAGLCEELTPAKLAAK